MKRWVGQMPWPLNATIRREARGGEPCPPNLSKRDRLWQEGMALYKAIKHFQHRGGGYFGDDSQGKAAGSYCEHIRSLLYEVQKKTGSPSISFDYHLSRHQWVRVSGRNPYLMHHPTRGAGKKGFCLEMTVDSIDGRRPLKLQRHLSFGVTRVRNISAVFGLPSGKLEQEMESKLDVQPRSRFDRALPSPGGPTSP